MVDWGHFVYLKFELLGNSLDILRVFLDGCAEEREDATVLLQNLVSSFLLRSLVLSGVDEELEMRFLASTILNVVKPEVSLVLFIGFF